MTKNIIKLNVDTNQIDEKIINQALVKGQHNYYEFEFHFYKNGNLYYDENLLFHVVFERADGEKTNKILLLRRGEIYYKKVNEWISDIVGELKISVQILDTQGDVIEAFPLITENVADGLRPSNTTIDEVQYDGILNDINVVNNALEEHKLESYTQSEIDQKDEEVLQEAKDYADSLVPDLSGIEQDITNLESGKLDKIWNDITSQSSTNLNDEFVLNRGGAVYKTTLANMLSNVVPIDIFVVVSALPEVGLPNKIYLVPSGEPETQNELDEYIWVDNDWEMIGNVSVDLEDYYTISEVDQIKVDIINYINTGLNQLETSKQDKLVAGDNITIDPITNVISYSIIPPRYIQTTVEDFNASGDYTGTAEYIILPADKPSGYQIRNINVKGVATNGDYLTSCHNMFNSNNSLYLELDYLDTSNVTNMSDMFNNSQATTLDLSSFDTSKVISMYRMFNNSQATTLDLSSFDTSNVGIMYRMFYMSQATTLDLSSFDTSKVTNMSDMFRDSQATTLDLSSFDTSNVGIMVDMFQGSQATTGYARTQTDADKFNSSRGKPAALTFVVKEDITQVSGRVDDLELAVSTKANDNEVVKLTGNQSIGGTKNFTGVLHFNGEEVATKADLSTVFNYKGQVPTFEDLPTEELKVGDVWDIADTGKNFAWNGTTWDDLGGIVDLSNYFNKTEINSMLDNKVDKVTGKALSTNDYTNTDKNKVDNIDQVYTSAEKTKLSGIETGAEVNVQSDWNATSGDAFILNKPTIPTNNNQLTNGAGYITGYTETDPIFTAWNKSTGISITKSQVSDLIEATQSISGLMSATDKTRLDVLHALLEEDTENNVVDSINEVLAIFNNYPEGADLVTALAGKVDKNTNITAGTHPKITYDAKGLVTGGEALVAGDIPNLNASKINAGTFDAARIPNLAPSKITQDSSNRFVTDVEKNTWNDKQDTLVAGDNITIDPNTNVISASGGEVDLNEMSYFDYAGRIYGAKYNLLANAWEHSLTVNPFEISANGTSSNNRGKAQYPNGETEGVIIRHSVKSIGNYAFYNWTSNNQPLVIPDSVTSIGSYAFSNWEANNHPLVIPNSVTSIGVYAFGYWNSNNQPLVIPESVTSIAGFAFNGWSSAKEFIMESETPPTITSTSFNNTNNAPFYVPDESVDDYKEATNWVDLASRIFPISDMPSDSVLDALKGTGTNSIQLGSGASAQGEMSTAVGYNAYATGDYSTALGRNADASAPASTALGQSASAEHNGSTAIGYNARANGSFSTAIGYNAKAEGVNSIAIGTETKVIENNVVDFGSARQVRVNETPVDDRDAVSKVYLESVISASGGEVDLDTMSYFDYAGSIYGAKYNLLASAWESSLAVDTSGISEDSDMSSPRGTAQYPDGETEGVIIPQGVTTIGTYAFSDWTSNNQPLVIPNSITSIGKFAFWDWTSNNQPLVIPNSVTSIGQYAFEGWLSNNQPLTIPQGVTSIGISSFANWSSNNQPLIIPNSVISIGSGAFLNWSLVPYVEMKATTPPSLANANAFNDQNNAPIYVPDESVDDYKEATQWVNLADRIFPISDKGNTYTKGEIDLMIGDIESALDAILGV